MQAGTPEPCCIHNKETAILLIITLLITLCGFNAKANTTIVKESDSFLVQSTQDSNQIVEGLVPIPDNLDDNPIMPMDIEFEDDRRWYPLTKNTTVYYAPYGTGCASTGYTLTAGTEVILMGREYDYFYVYWYIGNREMFGYIHISALNPSSYKWINYDLYCKLSCYQTIPVMSFAGSANTFIQVGEIYSGEDPLMALGSYVNIYNNHTYYIQYQTSNGLRQNWKQK